MSKQTSAGSALESAPARLDVRDLEIRLRHELRGREEHQLPARAGHLLGLVGESGSGKTTVALSLLGHVRRGLEIVNGQVILDGQISSPSTSDGYGSCAVRRSPTSHRTPPQPSIRRSGSGPSYARRSRPMRGAVPDVAARIAEVLQEVRLGSSTGILKRYPHQLSGGQQQRSRSRWPSLAALSHRARRTHDGPRRVDPETRP